MLIASPRQVDRKPGGYVEGWSTGSFAAYVRSRDPLRRLPLCRDHGGPWQAPAETAVDEATALAESFASFKADIDEGFRVLHIDTSVERQGFAPWERAVRRLVELYRGCADYAREQARDIAFEIGFEDQRPEIGDPDSFGRSLGVILEHLDRRGLPLPTYVVAQTGTKVVETRNEGVLARGLGEDGYDSLADRLSGLVEVCRANGVQLKAHNCDYLPSEAWSMLARCGVAGANVAPEYGVLESRALLDMLGSLGMHDARDTFIRLAFDSGKWEKWMAPRSRATHYERAVIAGHYVFSRRELLSLRRELARRLGNDDARSALRDAVKSAIRRHLAEFAWSG